MSIPLLAVRVASPERRSMTGDSVREWAEAYRVAWETANADAAAELFAEDGTYRSNIYEEPHRGRAGVVGYWTDVTSVQSEVTVRMGTPFVDGDRAVVEFWTTMSINEDPVTLSGALRLDFDDSGRCSALREYWNFTEGYKDPPTAWGE
jgi:predicted SnoaL-like aldol condensation-catalyzing enzyme